MPDPRWDNLKEIFNAAIALEPAERSTYLDRACDGNHSLRQAVQSLIKSHEESTNFVDKPGFQAAAEMLLGRIDFAPGQQVAHYRIISKIGEGGMGQVYLAEDSKLKRYVALKVLSSVGASDARRRLLREARAAAALDHPHICGIHEIGEANGTSYIAMQYVEGETLDVILKRERLTCDVTLTIARQIAEGLAEAHARNLIHRDIKPQNIMLTHRRQVKILDFGLAKSVTGGGMLDSDAETQPLLTRAGAIVGTVPYMSPEQVKGEALDSRSDIFSFGAVLYEMFTGRRPFAAKSTAEIISEILKAEPEPISSHSNNAPSGLQDFLSKCLAKDPQKRYQTMREVAIELERLSHAPKPTRPRTTGAAATDGLAIADDRSKGVGFPTSRGALALLATVMLVVIAGVYLWRIRTSQTVQSGNVKSVNSAAYDYYLRGKLNASSENRDNNETAIRVLEDVVKMEPSYAPAYAELARAYGIKANYFAPEAEKKKLNEDAKLAVEKSLLLDPNLAEGHFVRGGLLWTPANRFPHEQAIQSLKKAIVLDPNLEEAHHQLGVIYFHIGLLDKGEEELKKALAINPSDTLARFRLGSIEVCRGKYEEALAVLKTVPREANPSIVDRATAISLFQLGRTQEAAAVVEDYLKTYPRDEGGNVTSVKAMLLANEGKEREAEEIIKRAIEIGKSFLHFHHTTYNIASAYALMNKVDEALKWLQFTADDGFPCYPLFENDANLNRLRKDERFIAFMTKLKQQWQRYNATL